MHGYLRAVYATCLCMHDAWTRPGWCAPGTYHMVLLLCVQDDDPQKLQMQLKDRWRTLEKTVQKGGNARGVSLSTLQRVKEIADWKEGRLNEAARIALLAAAAGQEEG